MNTPQQRLAVGRPRIPRAPLPDDDRLNIEEPFDPRAMQRLYAALEKQRNSREMQLHFRASQIRDIESNQVDLFLSQALFEATVSPIRHRRAETSFQGKANLKGVRGVGADRRDSQEPHANEAPARIGSKQDGRLRVMANLQSYLTKSYENYRQNFYASTERQKTPQPSSTPSSLFQAPAPLSSSNLSKLLFPATFAKQASARKEESACTFVDFYTSHVPPAEQPPNLRDNARACRFFKITVSAAQAKESKPSVSTQSSGNSHFGC